MTIRGVLCDHMSIRIDTDEDNRTLTKLNQIVAVVKPLKAKTTRELTDFYRKLERQNLFTGRVRTYSPKYEDGDRFPNESQNVQATVPATVAAVTKLLAQLFDAVYTHEVANTEARADIVVDGQTILANVPVTYLLFLEKQLEDLGTFVSKIPVLDPEHTWSYDPNKGLFQAAPVETLKTKKVNKPIVMYEATKEHPAQVVMGAEDIVTGTWTQINLSGAVPFDVVVQLSERVGKLKTAVKYAREEANSADISDLRVAGPLLEWIFAPVTAAKNSRD